MLKHIYIGIKKQLKNFKQTNIDNKSFTSDRLPRQQVKKKILRRNPLTTFSSKSIRLKSSGTSVKDKKVFKRFLSLGIVMLL